jgi:hypothetical protein
MHCVGILEPDDYAKYKKHWDDQPRIWEGFMTEPNFGRLSMMLNHKARLGSLMLIWKHDPAGMTSHGYGQAPLQEQSVYCEGCKHIAETTNPQKCRELVHLI